MTRPSYKPNKRVPDGTTKAVLACLYSDAGGVESVAFVLGLGAARVYQLRDEGTLTLDDAARLTLASGSTSAAEYLATLAGGTFVPESPVDDDVASLVSSYAERSGDVLAKAVFALRDGEICAAEWGPLASDIDGAIRVLVAARKLISGGRRS
ncbi:MAG: hypothetical protein LCH38_14650 [Proteobacteria bacterium]|nr:hypothetical protein [Pseudomonadota bacterium]